MKKNILSVLISLSCYFALAQNVATPNPGFENWTHVVSTVTYDSLNGWDNLNPQTAILGIYTCTKVTGVDKHSGQYAIKLVTKQPFGIIANGITSTATLITTQPYGYTGGIPYTGRPDSIVGWFKNTPMSGDTAFIEFGLLDSVTNTRIGWATFNANTAHTTYQRFSAPVTYYSAATPNLSYWILSSSGRVDKYLNSTLFVDDIDLIFNQSSMQQNQNEDVSVTFNGKDKMLLINNSRKSELRISIYSMDGKSVMNTKSKEDFTTVSLAELKPASYIYMIENTATHKSIRATIVIE